jgi:septum site-determining protein MinD
LSKVIGILSGKGGVGKTTLVANLAASLTNDFKKNVIILDSNVTTSHLGLHLGLYEDLPVTLREVINRKSPIDYAIYIHPQTGIRLLPAPLNNKDMKFDLDRFQSIIDTLKKNYDIVLVDTAPGLGKEAIVATNVIDEGIIVTTPDIPSVTDALKTIDLLRRLKKNITGFVINRKKNEKYELSAEEISSNLECNLLSIIPEDNKVPISISRGIPLVIMDGNSSASIAIKILAGDLVNEKYQPKGFVYSLKKMLGLTKDYSDFKNRNQNTIAQDADEKEDVDRLKDEVLQEVKAELKAAVKEKLKQKMRKK